MTAAESDRREKIRKIQELLCQGYTAGYIRKLFGTTYYTIRRYKEGDPDLLCRFPEKPGISSIVDKYQEFIVACLNKKMTYTAILREVNKSDASIKKTAFIDYCKKLKNEYGINNNVNTIGIELNINTINTRYIKRKDVLKYLWTGEGLMPEDYADVMEKYDVISYLDTFILDFKSIFLKKDKLMLMGFIEIYEDSAYSKVKSFANGLLKDISAVENAVCLTLSNGFVEGNNNRVKMIKRTMYGRAKLPLLTTKVLYGQ